MSRPPRFSPDSSSPRSAVLSLRSSPTGHLDGPQTSPGTRPPRACVLEGLLPGMLFPTRLGPSPPFSLGSNMTFSVRLALTTQKTLNKSKAYSVPPRPFLLLASCSSGASLSSEPALRFTRRLCFSPASSHSEGRQGFLFCSLICLYSHNA